MINGLRALGARHSLLTGHASPVHSPTRPNHCASSAFQIFNPGHRTDVPLPPWCPAFRSTFD
ncbi:hypothetical protein B0H17DRAFT_1057434 [Mycena rosella]|uniref:Uncharacterized protein n=1 Tax=Mycena rosella TaxID=1033263 RepID=A0AAD7GLH5_MYCRO|nr:hypothetical protein B0H17DRAFT_1057434 [Mycena rosella]